MLQFDVERSITSYESSTYGCAFLSALGSNTSNTFSSLKDLSTFRKEPEVFRAFNENDDDNNNFLTWEHDLNQWKKCVKSFTKMS
jgi:glycerol kinase